MRNKDMSIFVLSVKLYDILETMTHIDDPYDGWEALKMMFEARDLVRKLHISNKLHTIKMEEGSQLTMLLKFIKEFKTQIVAMGKKVEDVVLIQIVLNALSPSYEDFIQTIIAQDALPSFEKIVSKLLYE
jgi:hypothetical protein